MNLPEDPCLMWVLCFAGSSPLSHDIRQDHVGDNTALLVEDLELTSGTPVFVSVIGKVTYHVFFCSG